MKEKNYAGKIKRYFRMPMYMIAIFVVINVIVYFQNVKYGAVISVLIAICALILYLSYRRVVKSLNREILDFATNYDATQKQIMEDLFLPYALLDRTGRIVWMNKEFAAVSKKERPYNKSITSIFPEITRESIEKATEKDFEIQVAYEDCIYLANLCRMSLPIDGGDDGENIELQLEAQGSFIAMFLLDCTELEQYKRERENQQFVAGLVYIDNYEDVYDSVEEANKGLLSAITERKINKYFKKVNALVRKLDRDKYFVAMQQQDLRKLEEDKFSLLEEIKSTKAGNELEITLSMGFGLQGESYVQNAEYSRAAIDLALGRGGSQAVIKEGEQISYYGIRGKEVEKNTRVKARMKAQALRELMENHEDIILMGHSIADVDSFGAAIGLYCAAREIGKQAKIVINTVTSSLRPFREQFDEEHGYSATMFIDSAKALEIANRHTLVILVDTNRPSYADCPELLERCEAVVVFDHHRRGTEQVQNPLLSYIEPYASSACEMIAEVLQYFSDKVELRPQEADAVYAGILIDTNNFVTKTGVRTFEAAAYLRRCGAEVTRVRKLLREDMSNYKARAEVVRHAEVYRGLFAISVCRAGEVESPTVVGAKAANELLNIVGIKASFVLTEYAGKVYVSSRSIDEIDVQSIMEKLGGGGHLNMAGAQVENSTVDQVKADIEHYLDDVIAQGEIE